jgi:hypothetical protein
MIWLRIPSNNCLHYYFSIDGIYNRKVMAACGLNMLPDRRTFDRRFKIMPVRDMIEIMGTRFVTEKIVDASIVSVDSSMIRARNGHIWHKKQMIKNMIPRSGIDTDARWGFSGTKGWLFGYKLHMSCSTGPLVVPLSAGVTPANIPDNQMYQELIGHHPGIQYIVADAGYDDHNLYDYSRQRGSRLVCPIRKYRHTKGKRLELISFYQSRKGQKIYGTRGVSIEPLFCTIKDTFGVSISPVIGFDNVSAYLLMCVFVYQVAVYWNCVINSDKPRCVKRMLGN